MDVAELTHDATDGFDLDYWRTHCHGFRVDGDVGRIGFVDDVLDQSGQPMLAVRAGLLGRRVWLIPAADVEFVVPRAERIWLRTPIRIAAGESGSRA